ncbi:hypothetical protein DUPY_02150 [Duganella phyllosphaerae]|uniref:Uncharacterized protein n=1 Tax=Duganella phyllosphaerae TaxID=762836 RepID=A0A1E7X7F1_9BURK|nr:hypothetical protein DUPY_02150 [Duganella phyllosphaerae]
MLPAARVCALRVHLRPRRARTRPGVPGQAPAQFHPAAAVDGVHAVRSARGGAAQRPAARRERLVATPGHRAPARLATRGRYHAGRSGIRAHRRPAGGTRRFAASAHPARWPGCHAPGRAPAVRRCRWRHLRAGPHGRDQRPDGAGARGAGRPSRQQHHSIRHPGRRRYRAVAGTGAACGAGQLDGHWRPNLHQDRARGATGGAATGAAKRDRPRAVGQYGHARDEGGTGPAQDGRYRPGAAGRRVF